MPKPCPQFPSDAKLKSRVSRLKEALLADPAFQEALQNIRVQFHVPYPATPEEEMRWYTEQFGGRNRKAFWNAVCDKGPEWEHFAQEAKHYFTALAAKYHIPLTLTWSLKSPFDLAVDRALQDLGLSNSFRQEFVAYLFSDNPWMVPCGHISYGTMESRVAGLTEYTVSFTTYESEADVMALLSSFVDMRKQDSKAPKGRPAQISNPQTLKRLILEAVQANDALPKGQRVTREALRRQLWQETRDKCLHTLSQAGFKPFFFSTLQTHGLTKRYMCL